MYIFERSCTSKTIEKIYSVLLGRFFLLPASILVEKALMEVLVQSNVETKMFGTA